MVKKLEDKEKQKSRQLWEEIFTEDTKEFLDYYYREKLKDNQILGSFQEEMLVSMLHLNPYRLCVGKLEIVSDYIVAVATKEEYRHQGRMAELLHEAMDEARKKGRPFVFLMPAKEAIYKPFDFVTVYGRKDYCFTKEWLSKATQREASFNGNSIYIEEITETVAEKAFKMAITELCKYSQRKLQEQYQVFAKRDEQYYGRLIKEQRSQQGSILLARDSFSRKICGYCFMTKEGTVQLRELVCDEHREIEILNAIWEKYGIDKALKLFGGEFSDNGLPVDNVFPCIMIRVTDICKFMELIPLQPEEIQWLESHPVIEVQDSFLEENQGQYFVTVEKQGKEFFAKARKQCEFLQKAGESQKAIPIFNVEEIVKKSFKKLKIFLNEVV